MAKPIEARIWEILDTPKIRACKEELGPEFICTASDNGNGIDLHDRQTGMSAAMRRTGDTIRPRLYVWPEGTGAPLTFDIEQIDAEQVEVIIKTGDHTRTLRMKRHQ